MSPSRRISHWAGLSLDRPLVMGMLNVTPDSFSDGGRRSGPDAAIAAGLAMAARRRGHHRRRRRKHPARGGAGPARSGAGTCHPGHPRACRGIGLRVGRHPQRRRPCGRRCRRRQDRQRCLRHWLMIRCAAGVVAELACPVVLMHMRGTPATMAAPARATPMSCRRYGRNCWRVMRPLKRPASGTEQIVIDPGHRLRQASEQSVAMLRGLPDLAGLGYPVLVGAITQDLHRRAVWRT